jgi:hypothetical protein
LGAEYFIDNKPLDTAMSFASVQAVKMMSNNDELYGYADIFGTTNTYEQTSSVRTVAIYRIDGNYSQNELNAIAWRMLYERNYNSSGGYILTFPSVATKFKEGDYFDGLGDITIVPPMPYKSGEDLDPAWDARDSVWQISQVEIKDNTTYVTVNSTYKTLFDLYRDKISEVKSTNPRTDEVNRSSGVIQVQKGLNTDIFQHDPLYIDASCTGDVILNIQINDTIQERVRKSETEGRFVEFSTHSTCLSIDSGQTNVIKFDNLTNIPAKYENGEVVISYVIDCNENCSDDCSSGCNEIYDSIEVATTNLKAIKKWIKYGYDAANTKTLAYNYCDSCATNCGTDSVCGNECRGGFITCNDYVNYIFDNVANIYASIQTLYDPLLTEFSSLETSASECTTSFAALKQKYDILYPAFTEFSTKYNSVLEAESYVDCYSTDCEQTYASAHTRFTQYQALQTDANSVLTKFYDVLAVASTKSSTCSDCFECSYLEFIHNDALQLYNVFQTYKTRIDNGVNDFGSYTTKIDGSCADCNDSFDINYNSCMDECGSCLTECDQYADYDACYGTAQTVAEKAVCAQMYADFKQCLCECSDCSNDCHDYCYDYATDLSYYSCMEYSDLCNSPLSTAYETIYDAYKNIQNYLPDKLETATTRVNNRYTHVYLPMYTTLHDLNHVKFPALHTAIDNTTTCIGVGSTTDNSACRSLATTMYDDFDEIYDTVNDMFASVFTNCIDLCEDDCEEFDMSFNCTFRPNVDGFPTWYEEDVISNNLVDSNESNVIYPSVQSFTSQSQTIKIRSWPGAPPITTNGFLPSMVITLNVVNNKRYTAMKLNNVSAVARFYYKDDTAFLSNKREYSELYIGDSYNSLYEPATNGYPLYAYVSGIKQSDIIKVYGYYLTDFATSTNKGYQESIPMVQVADYNTVKVFKSTWGINSSDHNFYINNKTDNRYYVRALTPKAIADDDRLYNKVVTPLNNVNVPHAKFKIQLKPTYRIDGINAEELARAIDRVRFFNDVATLDNNSTTIFERKYLDPVYYETLDQTYNSNITVIPRGWDAADYIRYAKIYINDYSNPLDIYNEGLITFSENLVNSTDGVRCFDVFEFGSTRPNIFNIYSGKKYDVQLDVSYNKYKNVHIYGENENTTS